MAETAGDLAGLSLFESIDQLDGGEEADALLVMLDGLHAKRGGDVISYRLPRFFLGQLRLSARCRRRAFLISTGILNCSATIALPSATLIGLPAWSRNS